MTKSTQGWIKKMNKLGMQRIPFFFMIDFEMKDIIVTPLNELSSKYKITIDSIPLRDNSPTIPTKDLIFEKFPVSLETYSKGFDIVKNHLAYGNSFLTNYTTVTPILSSYDLAEIFGATQAKYKLLVNDDFVVFSPETFVKISDGQIHSFPMKGTIDASVPNAIDTILADQKELAEHYTIVDLIRNDLSRVAKKVVVSKFRYIDRIESNDKTLLQVSSHITGSLKSDYLDHLGDIFSSLLPAGSISGAPKDKTLRIIREAEGQNRGMYTGVFGVFDGVSVDSGVAIRYIESRNGQLQYRSGGGITNQSDVATEYQEMIDKVYVPINRKYQNIQRESLQYSVAQPKM